MDFYNNWESYVLRKKPFLARLSYMWKKYIQNILSRFSTVRSRLLSQQLEIMKGKQ